MDKILEIKKLTKYYGKTKGIENLSLTLNKGEIFGLIGSNGAGKTTTIKCIMNLLNKTSGEVYIDGKLFTKDNYELKEVIGYLPSELHLYEEMTVREILDYTASFYKKDTSKRRKELLKLLKLNESKKIEELSLGNVKKVGIVLAFMHEPKLLILDEPTSGLDPIIQKEFYELLKTEKEKGTTIIYSTHILSEVARICDRVGIVKNGKLIKVEDIESLTSKNSGYVTIISNDVEEIKREIKKDIILKKDNVLKFKNSLNPNDLIKLLNKYNIEKILIEEMNLEDLFLYYYK